MNNTLFFSLRNSKKIAEEICDELGCELSPAFIDEFADGEILVESKISVRNKKIFLIGSLCNPVNNNIMEMLIFLDALKRASAKEITIVLTYYAYSRQDRKEKGRKPITASLLAKLLKVAGATKVLTVDLHNPSIQGFFDLPIDDLKGQYIFANHLLKSKQKFTVVSPDHGGATRARTLAELISNTIHIAIVDKRRVGKNKAEIHGILGNVKNKNCIIIDDIIDTGGTIVKAAKELMKQGANSVSIATTHGLFSNGFSILENCPIIDKVYVTNTIPSVYEIKSKKMEILSIAPLISKLLWASMGSTSMTSVYKTVKSKKTN